MSNLHDESAFLVMIKEIDDKIAASSLKDNTYWYSEISTFWAVFLELEDKLIFLMLVDVGIIFLVTLIMFAGDILTAFLTALACAMIVFQAFGLSCAFMKFNIFVAAISLMAMGLSVEFTAHLAAAFTSSRGTSTQ